MIWNSKNSTYYSKGRKAYSFGDELPANIVAQMGAPTLAKYIKKGWILDGKAVAEIETKAKTEAAAESKAAADAEDKAKAEAEEKIKAEAKAAAEALFNKAKGLGLKPHYKIGFNKLNAMIADYEALQTLKAEALELGIDPSDDVEYAELQVLVDEKKAEFDISLDDAGKRGAEVGANLRNELDS